MGVVVRRYIDIFTIIIILIFPTALVLSFFWQQHPTSLSNFKCFFSLVSVILQYLANVTQRTFKIVKKNRDHANIII